MQLSRQKIILLLHSLKARALYERIVFWVIFIISAVFLYFASSFAFDSLQKWNSINQRIHLLHSLSIKKEEQKKTLESQAIKYRHCDNNYLVSVVTAQPLIVSEAKKAEVLIQEKDFSSSNLLNDILQNGSRFRFVEKARRTYSEGEEVEWAMESSVLMNEEDLKKILALIEGFSYGKTRPPAKRPLLLVKKFELEQLELPSRDRVYRVRMDILQRLFSPSGRAKSST